MSTTTNWHPSWWKQEVHGTAWERVKAAMERDWTQTRHDLGIGGHELNQDLTDTVKQAANAEAIPRASQANPPRVIGEWIEAEIPYGYGHAARQQFGTQHPQWTPELETKLSDEWNASQQHAAIDWQAARNLVHRGYDYNEASSNWPSPFGMM